MDVIADYRHAMLSHSCLARELSILKKRESAKIAKKKTGSVRVATIDDTVDTKTGHPTLARRSEATFCCTSCLANRCVLA